MEALRSNMFSSSEPGLFDWFYQAILDHGDYYCHLADLESYIPTAAAGQRRNLCNHPCGRGKPFLNVARIGKFSSDRTIREYARDIWHIQSVS